MLTKRRLFKGVGNAVPLFIVGVLFLLLILTQFYQIIDVPGLHYDEAWQARHADEIAFLRGFWPTEAMNAYTLPIVHYALAVVFRLLGTSIETLRYSIGILNIISSIFLSLAVWRISQKKWIAIITLLLTLSTHAYFIHARRFYIEVHYWFYFVAATVFFLMTGPLTEPRRNSMRQLGALLLIALGALSHVLFCFYGFSLFVTEALLQKRTADPKQTNTNLFSMRQYQFLFFLFAGLFLRMHLGTAKLLPLGAFFCFVVVAVFIKKAYYFIYIYRKYIFKALGLLAAPLILTQLTMNYSGLWPYAQVTGVLRGSFLIGNGVAAIAVLFNLAKHLWPDLIRNSKLLARPIHAASVFYVLSLLCTAAVALKPSPKYYFIPSLVFIVLSAMVFSASEFVLPRYRMGRRTLGALILAANLSAFYFNYLKPFQLHGATSNEFYFGFLHDNARDFRPFQKVVRHLAESGCLTKFHRSYDDRFNVPIVILKKSYVNYVAPQSCAVDADRLYFSSISNYCVTCPKPNNVYKHDQSWGDLALFLINP